GVTWVADDGGRRGPGAPPVVLTRLHIRYTKEPFPEDLAFQETKDRGNFQTRYILPHPWRGTIFECLGPLSEYRRDPRSVAGREEQGAQALGSLAGWNIDETRRRKTP